MVTVGAINVTLILNCLVSGTLKYVFVPSALQRCDCGHQNAHMGSTSFFNFFLLPLLVSGLAVFQLMIARNGQHAFGYRTVAFYLVAVVAVCSLVMISLPFAFSSAFKRCLQLCQNVISTSIIATAGSLVVAMSSIWILSLVVIVISYAWILVLYQTWSLVSDINLSFKMLSLPVLVPFTLIIVMIPPALIESIIIISTRESSFYGFSANTVTNVALLYVDIAGLVYPLLLLYVNKYVWKDWKSAMELCCCIALEWFKCAPHTFCHCVSVSQVSPVTEP